MDSLSGDTPIKSRYLKLITGAYFSGKGYFTQIEPEVPDSDLKPDVIAVKPIPRLARQRLERGAAPVGILYLLDKEQWVSTRWIIDRTGFPGDFVLSVLMDGEKEGWIISRKDHQDEASWKIKDYAVPARECIFLCCATENPSQAINILLCLKGMYHKGYLIFPYDVAGKFIHDCQHKDIGILVFDEPYSRFRELLKARRQKITGTRAYYSICEKAIVNFYLSASMTRKIK